MTFQFSRPKRIDTAQFKEGLLLLLQNTREDWREARRQLGAEPQRLTRWGKEVAALHKGLEVKVSFVRLPTADGFWVHIDDGPMLLIWLEALRAKGAIARKRDLLTHTVRTYSAYRLRAEYQNLLTELRQEAFYTEAALDQLEDYPLLAVLRTEMERRGIREFSDSPP